MKVKFFLFLIALGSFSTHSQTPILKTTFWQLISDNESSLPNIEVECICPGMSSPISYLSDSNGLVDMRIVVRAVKNEINQFDTVSPCHLSIFNEDYGALSFNLNDFEHSISSSDTNNIHLLKMEDVKFDTKRFNDLVGLISIDELVTMDSVTLFEARVLPFSKRERILHLKRIGKNRFEFAYSEESETLAQKRKNVLELTKIKVTCKKRMIIKVNGDKLKFDIKSLMADDEFRFKLIKCT